MSKRRGLRHGQRRHRPLRKAGISTAVVPAGRNYAAITKKAAGTADLFDTRVDGREADRLHLPGKPEPALFSEAAHRMGSASARTAAVESLPAGVEAGARCGFGLVVEVDRGE